MFSLIRNPLMRLTIKSDLLANVASNKLARAYSSKQETEGEFDSRWESFFKKYILKIHIRINF